MAWFTKKEWKNRLAEFAGRRTLTDVATGASQVVDVARNEGTISQEGDAFSAANMNEFEQRILEGFTQAENAATELNQNLKFPDGVGFYPDTKDGKRGYNTDPARGADTFFPFKGEYKIEIVNGNSPAGTAHDITIPPCEFFVVVAIDVQDGTSSMTYSISEATVLNEKISNSLTYSTKALYTRVYTAVCEGVDETTIVTITTSQFVQVGSKQIFAYCFVN